MSLYSDETSTAGEEGDPDFVVIGGGSLRNLSAASASFVNYTILDLDDGEISSDRDEQLYRDGHDTG